MRGSGRQARGSGDAHISYSAAVGESAGVPETAGPHPDRSARRRDLPIRLARDASRAATVWVPPGPGGRADGSRVRAITGQRRQGPRGWRGTLAVADGRSRSALVFGPGPDAAARRVDAGPRLGDPESGPLADGLQRPGWRQRPRPPPREMRARTAAAEERPQDRPRRLGVVVWSAAAVAADHLAAIRQLQPEAEGPPGRAQVPGRIGHPALGIASARPDAGGHEDLESGGVDRYPGARHGDLLGPPELQGLDRYDARETPPRAAPMGDAAGAAPARGPVIRQRSPCRQP